MGATKVVTDETFDAQVLQNSKPVIVDYWAEWCGPCRMVAPVLEEIANEHADKIDVVKLNIDENPTISQRYQIMAIPTMSVFQNGQVVKQIVGAKPKAALLRELAEFMYFLINPGQNRAFPAHRFALGGDALGRVPALAVRLPRHGGVAPDLLQGDVTGLQRVNVPWVVTLPFFI